MLYEEWVVLGDFNAYLFSDEKKGAIPTWELCETSIVVCYNATCWI